MQLRAYIVNVLRPVGERFVQAFQCDVCGIHQLLDLRAGRQPPPLAEMPAAFRRVGDTWHKADCRHARKGAAWRGDDRLEDVLRTTLLVDGEPQPCRSCLGRDVDAYLGVVR